MTLEFGRAVFLATIKFRAAFEGRGDADRGHAGGGGGLDAEISVFKDETVSRRDAEALGGGEEGVGRGLAARVIFRADDEVELVEKADGSERVDDRFTAAAGDDCEGNAAVHGVDVFEDFYYGLELRKKFIVEILLAFDDGLDGHFEAADAVESTTISTGGRPPQA